MNDRISIRDGYGVRDGYGSYIDGQWRPASDGATLESHDPAMTERLAIIADATRQDVDAAVSAARTAFGAWSRSSVAERSGTPLAIADLIEANLDHPARVEPLDNGEPIRETSGADLPLSVDHFRCFVGRMRADEGSATMLDTGALNIILREPLGLVGRIVPWNPPSSWRPGSSPRRWSPAAPSSSSPPAPPRCRCSS